MTNLHLQSKEKRQKPQYASAVIRRTLFGFFGRMVKTILSSSSPKNQQTTDNRNFLQDIAHFEEHFAAYQVRDGAATFDSAQNEALQTEAQKNEFRLRREKECFSIINRGQLWYEGVSITQLLELRQWYKAWLNVTETMVVPEKPSWLE